MQEVPVARLGEGPVEVPRVVLGAWAIGGWFWGGTDDSEAIAAIRASYDAGVKAVDTAPIYGMGHSERVVGKALAQLPDDMVVLTKVGMRWDDDRGAPFFRTKDNAGNSHQIFRNLRPDSIQHEVHQSLERLGVDTIDVVQCHWPDPTTPIEESMGALAALVAQGKVRAVGVSNFKAKLLERAQAALQAEGVPLSSHQPPYSLLNRKIEDDALPWCHTHGVGTIVYSPMERGLLTGKIGPERTFAEGDGRRDDPKFSVENRVRVAQALDQAREMALAHDCTLAQLSVAWVLHRTGVTAALVGARNATQATENARAASVELSDSEVEALAALFAEVELGR